MARRRSSQQKSEPVPAANPDPLRRWLLAGGAMLFVARPMVLSDGGPWLGEGEPFAAVWIVLAGLWTIGRLRTVRSTFRFGLVDAGVVALFGWWSASAIGGMLHAAPRPSLNMLWEGVATAAAFLMARQLVATPREARALVAVMIGLGVALAGSAFHQYFVSLPADRAAFKADTSKAFHDLGLPEQPPGTADYEDLAARLNSPEPFATFSLTNSLAAYLAPWLVLTVGIGIGGGRDSASRRWTWLAAALCGLPLVGALALTRSRSAWIGTLVGAALLFLVGRGGGFRWSRKAWLAAGAVAAVLAAGVIGVAILKPDWIDRAERSFSFRTDYWKATVAMIEDRPLLGTGPGNFAEYYTRYKLPTASEEIKDPHNFVLETAAIAGLPAALLLLALLAGFAWRVGRSRGEGDSAAVKAAAPANAETAGPDATGWVLGGAAVGFGLALMLRLIFLPSAFVNEIVQTVAGLLLASVAVALLWRWIRAGRLPPQLLATGVAALLVALLAVGGFTFSGVSGTLWLLLALGLNVRDGFAARRSASRKWMLVLLAAVGVLAYEQHETGYGPVMACRKAMEGFQNAIFLPNPRDAAQEADKQLMLAADADPLAIEPRQQLARQRFEAWNKFRDRQLLNDFEKWTQQVLELNPLSDAVWREAGIQWLTVARAFPAQTAYANLAVKTLSAARDYYPTSAEIWSDLAEAFQTAGRTRDAIRAARESLRLDRVTPHADKKLTEEQRQRMTKMLPVK